MADKDKNRIKIETVRSTGKNTKKDTAKKPQASAVERYRFPIVAGMCVFVLFVMIWSFTQTVKGINLEKDNPVSAMEDQAQDKDSQKDEDGQADNDNTEEPKEEVKSGKEINMEALAKKLIKEVGFETKLAKLDDSVASGMIAAADGTELKIYMGNGSSADELILMKAESESAAQDNMKSAEEHLKEMQKSMEGYLPEQAKKIDNAVKVQSGTYVFICVAADTAKAKKIINNAVK